MHQISELVGNTLDVHALAQPAIIEEPCPLLVFGHAAAAEAVEPADRLADKGRQDVEHVGVVDPEAPVHGVHPGDRPAPSRAVQAVFDCFGQQEFCIVIAFARPGFELPGFCQKSGDRGHRVGSEQSELKCTFDVPGELVGVEKTGDLLIVLFRVKRRNSVSDLR